MKKYYVKGDEWMDAHWLVDWKVSHDWEELRFLAWVSLIPSIFAAVWLSVKNLDIRLSSPS